MVSLVVEFESRGCGGFKSQIPALHGKNAINCKNCVLPFKVKFSNAEFILSYKFKCVTLSKNSLLCSINMIAEKKICLRILVY